MNKHQERQMSTVANLINILLQKRYQTAYQTALTEGGLDENDARQVAQSAVDAYRIVLSTLAQKNQAMAVARQGNPDVQMEQKKSPAITREMPAVMAAQEPEKKTAPAKHIFDALRAKCRFPKFLPPKKEHPND
ncbi:MAG: hypothetical protein ACOZBH_02925 [Patescibacteria group bacterium]